MNILEGQSISKFLGGFRASFPLCCCKYKKWSKEEQPVNRRQGHGHPVLSGARGERRRKASDHAEELP